MNARRRRKISMIFARKMTEKRLGNECSMLTSEAGFSRNLEIKKLGFNDLRAEVLGLPLSEMNGCTFIAKIVLTFCLKFNVLSNSIVNSPRRPSSA